jgi:hypothetical protein
VEPPQNPEAESDRVLWGAEKIAAHVDLPVRSALHLLSKGKLPGTKIGKLWTSHEGLIARSAARGPRDQ